MRVVFVRSAVRCALVSAGALIAALAGGCGLIGEGATSAVVAPGKFSHYNCKQLAETRRSLVGRERELSELMARAAQGPMGEFVGAVSYRTELMQARGQLRQIEVVAAEKNCAVQSRWQSDRALW